MTTRIKTIEPMQENNAPPAEFLPDHPENERAALWKQSPMNPEAGKQKRTKPGAYTPPEQEPHPTLTREQENALDIAERYLKGEELHGDEMDALQNWQAPPPDRKRELLERLAALDEKATYPEKDVNALLDDVREDIAPAFLDAVRTDFPADPPKPAWLCKNWIPADAVTVLTGRGGAGKSRIALQLAVAVATGQREFLNPQGAGASRYDAPVVSGNEPAPVIFATWETSEAAFDWRLKCALEGAGKSIENLEGRFIHANMRHAAAGGIWGVKRGEHVSTAGGLLPAGEKLLELAEKARLLVVDPVAAAFMQNENDRALVRAFLAALGAWAETAKCAVILISHPPKYTGAAQSGSTDWRNGVQSVIELGGEVSKIDGLERRTFMRSDVRVMRVEKLNEGTAPQGINVTWNTNRFAACAPSQGAMLWTGTEWRGTETQANNGEDKEHAPEPANSPF